VSQAVADGRHSIGGCAPGGLGDLDHGRVLEDDHAELEAAAHLGLERGHRRRRYINLGFAAGPPSKRRKLGGTKLAIACTVGTPPRRRSVRAVVALGRGGKGEQHVDGVYVLGERVVYRAVRGAHLLQRPSLVGANKKPRRVSAG